MPPPWIQIAAGTWTPLSIAAAPLVLADIYLLGRRQPMAIMEAFGRPCFIGTIGLPFYAWFGRGARSTLGDGG